MTYFLIICFAILMLYAYRTLRAITRFPESQFTGPEYFIGTDLGVILCACLVTVPTIFNLGFSEPMGRAERKAKLQIELNSYEYRGFKLAQEMLGITDFKDTKKEAKEAGDTSSEATATAPEIPSSLTVLLIGSYETDTQRQYFDIQKAGLERGFKEAGVSSVTFIENVLTFAPPMEGASYNFNATPKFVWPQLDALVKEHADVNAVVMLDGLPEDYAASFTAGRCRKGEVKVGAICSTVFTLGGDILSGKLSAILAPRLVQYSPGEYREFSGDLKKDFLMRYMVLTSDPIRFEQVLRANPRLFPVRTEL